MSTISQGFSHFLLGVLHNFVLAKLASSSIWFKGNNEYFQTNNNCARYAVWSRYSNNIFGL